MRETRAIPAESPAPAKAAPRKAAKSPKKAEASPKKIAAKNTGAATKTMLKSKTHPPASEMVNAAIATLEDKKGSSLQAIKKYIETTYKIDLKKQSTFIKKYLKSAVEKKTIVQVKGVGASGRFKLVAKGEGEKATKKPAAKKPVAKKTADEKKAEATTPATSKKTAAKKPAGKNSADEKKTAAKKPVAKPKSPSKAKKIGEAPTTKPKAPKPKKAAAPKAKPAKK